MNEEEWKVRKKGYKKAMKKEWYVIVENEKREEKIMEKYDKKDMIQ